MTGGHRAKVHQLALAPFVRDELLTREDVEKLKAMLKRNKTLDFKSAQVKGSNLYASGVGQQATSTVWVRDNIFLAFSFYITDKDGSGTKTAVAIVNDVATYFLRHAARFDDVIGGGADMKNPMHRPHVRFNGSTMDELDEYWNHKQNDALGYFLWLRCRLCADGKMRMSGDHLRLLGLMLEYLVKIEFWCDEDSGHWEETPKVSASSIGAVVAGAKEFKKLLDKYEGMIVPCADGTLDEIEERGVEVLEALLPRECASPGKEREVDSALLFLIYPLNIVPPGSAMAKTILRRVDEQLSGKIGLRRYNGDGYWCKDFKERFAVHGKYTKVATSDQDIAIRNKLAKPGEEAQWCIFDSTLSSIYGLLYKDTKDYDDLKRQQFHFGRSLAQVTGPECPSGAWHLPECYYLSKGQWVASDMCGSLWAKANLEMAFHHMDISVSLSSDELKAEFKRFDIAGMGNISLDDLVTVLCKLNADLPADDLVPFLNAFAPNGKINFEQLVDSMFCGTMAAPAKKAFNFRGVRPPQQMSTDELQDVERVVTDALLEMHGEFEGEYYPMPKSHSYPARLGGMSKQEAQLLETEGLLFKSKECIGRGVFATLEKDIAIFVNAESHLEVIVKPELGDHDVAPRRLKTLVKFLGDHFKFSGYHLA